MRVFAALIAAIALAAPALAQSGWRGDIERGFTGPVYIASITIGDELAEDDEDYGAREFDRLTADLHDEVASRLMEANRFVAEPTPGAARLDLIITDVKPNRPTMNQLARTPGLSLRSFGIGGAEIEGVLYASDGATLGEFRYRYFSNDIRDAQGRATWSDARRSFNRFARALVRELNGDAS